MKKGAQISQTYFQVSSEMTELFLRLSKPNLDRKQGQKYNGRRKWKSVEFAFLGLSASRLSPVEIDALKIFVDWAEKPGLSQKEQKWADSGGGKVLLQNAFLFSRNFAYDLLDLWKKEKAFNACRYIISGPRGMTEI